MNDLNNEALQNHPFAHTLAPSNWKLVVLADIASDLSPGFASGKHNSEGSGIPHLRPMNIDRNGQIDLSIIKSLAESKGIQLERGDVLFNNTNSAELIGKTAVVSARESGFAFSNHMTRVRPEIGVNSVFVARQLHFLWMSGYMRHRCTNHVNQASISSTTLAKTIPIFLPPTSEQSRIVEKLEELLSDLDAGVAELKAAQKKLVQYRQSLLKAAVEGKLTEQWRNNRYASSPQYLTDKESDTTASETAANTPLSPRGRGVGGEGATTSGLPHNAWLRDRARELRKAQTPQEQALWQHLRAKRFSGFKFRRQQVIGRYIADFVCFEQKLVIELDGSQHSDTKQADAQRDHWLNGQGFRVLRFWNNQWQSQQAGVLEAIWQALHEDKPSPPLPNPSPTRGEGLSVTPDVDEKGSSGTQPDASFCLDERGAGEAVESGAQLLERILKERRARWEAKQLAKFQEQGKAPPKGWQDKYPEPVKPDTRDLPELPEGWVWASVEQIASDERYSLAIGPFGSNLKVPDYRDSGVPLVFVRNIRSGNYGGAYTKYVTHEKAVELGAHSIKAGDVLVTKMGDPPGDADIYPAEQPPAIITADCIKIRCWNGLMSPFFLKSVINTHIGKRQIELMTQGVAQKKVSLGRFSSLAVPVPSRDEQEEIIWIIDSTVREADAQLFAIDLSLKQSAAQRKNILKAAFSGQLVPQDPNDEPASVLLERIRAERATQTLNGKLRKRSTSNA